MIPKRLHFIWLGEPMPAFNKACMQSVIELHPDWDVEIHYDNSVFDAEPLSKLRDKLKAQWEVMATCDGLHSPLATQADLLRLCLIYVYGGVYLDCDFYALRPLDKFLSEEIVLAMVDNEGLVGEAVLGMRPLDPRLLELIEVVADDKPYAVPQPNGEMRPNICTNVTHWAEYNKFRLFPPEYFIPHIRKAKPETIYDVTPNTHLLHCWRQHDYDLERLKALRPKGE